MCPTQAWVFRSVWRDTVSKQPCKTIQGGHLDIIGYFMGYNIKFYC